MDAIAETRLRLALRCLIGAGSADRELLICPQWQTCVVNLCEMMNRPIDLKEDALDPYAQAREPKPSLAPVVNAQWQNRDTVERHNGHAANASKMKGGA